jgi:hypothetical protein
MSMPPVQYGIALREERYLERKFGDLRSGPTWKAFP